ncbi:hypothetical protein INH39_08260 [Massilia violaceinigra]|uniref:Uncharacterized protein n=1 Tax=Massilia violaceinigra TaxID=2045208 RepID=A0ABY4AAF0_9BURK|nr:hypothetical protein [Massilia violaceinigra]UOD31663.1 hypothetical protein INH39_08260 [Massilia violaceinigra]
MKALKSKVKTDAMPKNAILPVRIPSKLADSAADNPYAMSPQEAAKALRRAGIVTAKGRLARIFK